MNRSQKFEFTVTERTVLILSLQHSLKYLHHCYLGCGPVSREYWLSRIRETYSVYRRVDYGYATDHYAAVVKNVTKERI